MTETIPIPEAPAPAPCGACPFTARCSWSQQRLAHVDGRTGATCPRYVRFTTRPAPEPAEEAAA